MDSSSNDSKNPPIINTPQHQNETPSHQTPLQLSGFLTGDTIQVQGDTGELRFSVRLDILNKKLFSEIPPQEEEEEEDHIIFPTGDYDNYSSLISLVHDTIASPSSRVVTRLKSGAISPVSTYFPRVLLWRLENHRRRSGNRGNSINKRMRKEGVFERFKRRRSFPARPCTSYAFFVMSFWGQQVKVSSDDSFGETSKRIARMWCQLSSHQKKLYEEMAVKDSERYKRQAELFTNYERRSLRDEEDDRL